MLPFGRIFEIFWLRNPLNEIIKWIVYLKLYISVLKSDNGRCFIADLDETEIQKPTNICQLLHGIETGGVYKMDLNEVRKETFAHEINSVNSTVFGCPIATISRNSCDKFYQLYDIHDEILDEILDQDYGLDEIRREKRSADDDVNNEYDFVEFAGKSLVKYNIVNVKDLWGEKW